MAIDTAVHVQVVIPNEDGLAVDEFVTSLNYQTAGVDSAGMSALITSFFNDTPAGGTSSIGKRFSPSVSRSTPCQIRYYDVTAHLDGSPHGAPFQVDEFTMTAMAGGTLTNLPNQVCCVLSYYSALDSEGTTTGRHRGRMFLGPLSSEVLTTTTAGNPRLNVTYRTDCTLAFKALFDGANALTNPKVLSVWTRKSAGMESAIGCWMEDRLDTQRRRALGATTRTTVTPL